jgi:cell division protein FtsB
VDETLQKNAELEYDIEHAGDDETIEEIARIKLGLVKAGEKIFYDVGN